MKLELADFTIKDIRFSRQTSYRNGLLLINRDELVKLVLEDNRIALADIDIAFPGNQTRIVRIRDVVEPRIKVVGPGCVFPGILGSVETVGEGRTHRLSGASVIVSAEYQPTILSGIVRQDSGIIDMWGPGARLTPFGSTINIILVLKLIAGVTEKEAHTTIQLAEFKVANRLAETTRQQSPQNVEIFELSQVNTSLPRVVYIVTAPASPRAVHPGLALYGLPITESLPTFIHPNEFFDGAMTKDVRRGRGMRPTTWEWLNQPMILKLLREHGKRLNFLGVILEKTEFEDELGKQVAAALTSQMARLLGADGAIITKITSSGNSFIEVMLTVQGCEKKGVKTVLLTPEWGGSKGTQTPLIFYVPEATAMVSTGSHELAITLPAPTKVIGAEEGELIEVVPGEAPVSPWGELSPQDGAIAITGGVDWLGRLPYTCQEY